MKLNLLVLRTDKLDSMRQFYSSLGARFESERHGKGPEHYAATLGDNFVLELYPCIDETMSDSSLRMGLEVDSIGEALRSLGQSVVPRRTKWGLVALVCDPDGRTIELTESNTIDKN